MPMLVVVVVVMLVVLLVLMMVDRRLIATCLSIGSADQPPIILDETLAFLRNGSTTRIELIHRTQLD